MLETRAKTARHIPLNNRPEKKVLHDGDLLQDLSLIHFKQPSVHLVPIGHPTDIIQHG